MEGEATRFTRRSQGVTGVDPALDAALASTLRTEIEESRWFQGKGRALLALRAIDRLAVPGADGGTLAIVAAEYGDGMVEHYALPLRSHTGGMRGAGADDPLWPALACLSIEGGSIDGLAGRLSGEPCTTADLPPIGSGARRLNADQSNSSVVLGERVVFKCYRRLRPGTHPEETKRGGYRTLLYRGSPFDEDVLEWARSRSSPVIAVGAAIDGAAFHVPLTPVNETVTALVETGVAELVAAQLWRAAAEMRAP